MVVLPDVHPVSCALLQAECTACQIIFLAGKHELQCTPSTVKLSLML